MVACVGFATLNQYGLIALPATAIAIATKNGTGGLAQALGAVPPIHTTLVSLGTAPYTIMSHIAVVLAILLTCSPEVCRQIGGVRVCVAFDQMCVVLYLCDYNCTRATAPLRAALFRVETG